MGIIADIHEDLEKGALQLIVEYRGRLQAEAMRLCHDATAADDLVMRTFETVLFRIDKYRPDGNLYGWMKSILTSLHFNDGLRAVNRNTTPTELDELEKIVPEDNSTLEEIMRNSDGEAVREALNRIDPKYREVLVLHYFKDYSFREISGILKLPLGTVGRRVQIARQILAAKLKAEFRAAGRKLSLFAAFLLAGSLFGAVTWGVVEAVQALGSLGSEGTLGSEGSLGTEGTLGTAADPIDFNDPNSLASTDQTVPSPLSATGAGTTVPNSPTTLSTTENTNATEEETMKMNAIPKAVRATILSVAAVSSMPSVLGADVVDPIRIVSSRCSASGACKSVTLGFSRLAAGGELWVAWGATDGGGTLGDWENSERLKEGLGDPEPDLTVSIPAGAKYVRFFCTVYELDSLRGDGKAYIQTPAWIDTAKGYKTTLVFRSEDGFDGSSMAVFGARTTAFANNFSVNIGAGTVCVDAINNKNSQTTGRLTCTGLSAEHWYQAEISQNERKLTDLTTGKVVGTENTSISTASDVQLCLYDIGKYNASSHSMRRFTGSIKRLTIEKSGEVKFDYVPRKVNGVWTFVNTVNDTPTEVQGGTLSGDEFRSTETLFAGADEFGSGRRIVSVADVRSKGRVTAHQLSFAASDGIDYLLYRCSGNAPKGADYQAWPNCEAVDYIPASSNSYVCAVPEGWGESCSLVRYFLVKPRWAAKGRSWLAETPEDPMADGAYVDTKLTLKSGDTMTVDFCPSVRQKAFAVAGCRAGAASKNITVSATMATASNNVLNIYCDYNNGDQTAYQLKSSARADRTKWYRAELSVGARCASEIGGDWAETNDTAYADSAFETTGTCQLFYAGGSPSSGWSKFLGAIRSFTLVRDGETLADFVPFAEGANGGFIDKVTHQRFESAPGSGYQLGVMEIDELVFGASKTIDAHAKSGLILLVY